MAKALENIVNAGKKFFVGLSLAATLGSGCFGTFSGGIVVPRESDYSKREKVLQELRADLGSICDKYKVTPDEFYCGFRQSMGNYMSSVSMEGKFEDIAQVKVSQFLGIGGHVTIIYKNGKDHSSPNANLEKVNRIAFNLLYLATNR